LIAATLAVAAVGAGCGTSDGGAKGPLDARTLVVQPHDVGGLRVVSGSWNELGDDGFYPLADALGGRRPGRHIAFQAPSRSSTIRPSSAAARSRRAFRKR
jgi:hypothetical protein